jgi:chaperonin cofactor prefoldin
MNDNEIIDELKERIKYLENLHDSLRKEIRTQRKEISALREERRMILDADRTPVLDNSEEINLYND